MSAKKKYDLNEEVKASVNEPVSLEISRKLTFFNSFEELSEADAKFLANLTPIEHLQNVTALIEKLYAEELSKPITERRIIFEKE